LNRTEWVRSSKLAFIEVSSRAHPALVQTRHTQPPAAGDTSGNGCPQQTGGKE